MSDLFLFHRPGWLMLACLLCYGQQALAHGGVSQDGDLCIIQIDFFKAHFTIYQPETRANREYCEDIPDVTTSVFVMDYLHKSLAEMPVDFRIIRDVNDLGRFARWEQIEEIDDMDAATVFYQPPVTRPDAVFQVEHEFDAPGNYIGIVTTKLNDKVYKALFPFEVGSTGFGYIPLFIGLVVLAQANYWVFSGGYANWRTRRSKPQQAET